MSNESGKEFSLIIDRLVIAYRMTRSNFPSSDGRNSIKSFLMEAFPADVKLRKSKNHFPSSAASTRQNFPENVPVVAGSHQEITSCRTEEEKWPTN
jgi:hypothetical protein